MKEPLRRVLRARALSGLTTLSRVTPPPLLSASLGAAAVFARRGALGARARRNLELALGSETTDQERERILRGAFAHSARLFQDWLRLSRGAAPEGPRSHEGQWIEDLVSLDDSVEHLHGILGQGRGAIIVSAHIGDWELGCARLRRLGLQGTVVGLQRKRDSSTRWLVDMRRAYGIETIPQDSPPRLVLEVLRKGHILGLVTDLEVRRLAGEFIPFFSRPALTMSAPAALARAHGTALVPMRCVARGKGYVLSIEPPLTLRPGLDRRAAATDLLERMNGVFETWIREDPDQWAWHQHRWRTEPGDLQATPLASRGR